MPHISKLGNPPPLGTPLDAPAWLAWKREVAEHYASVLDEWGSAPWLPQGSVPTVRRRATREGVTPAKPVPQPMVVITRHYFELTGA